jgi:hypothetical protein
LSVCLSVCRSPSLLLSFCSSLVLSLYFLITTTTSANRCNSLSYHGSNATCCGSRWQAQPVYNQ